MRAEPPLLLEQPEPAPAPPPPAPPVIPPGARLIRGRVIQRGRGGWYEAVPQPPKLVEVSGPYGRSETRSEPRPDQIVWQAPDPAAEVEALGLEQPGWREFSPRGPDDEHDEYEQLLTISTYFAAKFAAQFKIGPRKPLPGVPLGTCYRSHGTAKVNLNDDELRELVLSHHAVGDWGSLGKLTDVTLDDDMRWCPVFFGQTVCNAVAVERGAGVLKSVWPRTFEKTRGVEEVKAVTLINQATYIYIPTRDAMS